MHIQKQYMMPGIQKQQMPKITLETTKLVYCPKLIPHNIMECMFGCSILVQFLIRHFKFSMILYCSLKTIPQLDTSKVTKYDFL